MRMFEYKVIKIRSMYDGDSVKITALREHVINEQNLDFGFGDIIKIPEYKISKEIDVDCRMYGFDTPELRDRRPMFKAAGYLAKDRAFWWMNHYLQKGGITMISLKTSKDQEAKGKFGRYLSNFKNIRNETLKDFLIENYLAVPYHGQNKADIELAHLDNFEKLIEAGLIKRA